MLENVSLHYGSGKGPALEQVTCSINMAETTAGVTGKDDRRTVRGEAAVGHTQIAAVDNVNASVERN